ncbi:MAG: hypothetical protein EAZ53_16315 [Bacteroidetes bacterium]|nr:MAG: hypothetical protein EAZ53_16315 [Bacteroidota bacterium]
MNRNDFIKNVTSLVGFSGLPKEWVKSYKKVYLLQFFVRGFQFNDGLKALDKLKDKQLLNLKREPENPYDKNAISLYFNEFKIGYVPREDNEVLARLMDAKVVELLAEVVKINKNVSSWENVNACIYVLKQENKPINENNVRCFELESPNYFTLSHTDDSYISRVSYKKNENSFGENFYDLLVEKSNNDSIYDLIHNNFSSQEFDLAFEKGMFVIDISKIKSKVLEDIQKTEDLIYYELNKSKYYITSGADFVAENINEIKSFSKIKTATEEILYEIIWKKT